MMEFSLGNVLFPRIYYEMTINKSLYAIWEFTNVSGKENKRSFNQNIESTYNFLFQMHSKW